MYVYSEYSDYYVIYRFNSDGTGVLTKNDPEDGFKVQQFYYKFFEDSGILKTYYKNDIETYYIEFVQDNQLTMYCYDAENQYVYYDSAETYIRQ